MQSFESITDPAEALLTTDFSPQLPGQDFQESDEFGSHPEDHPVEPPSTDDPVRVYLREMGSVRLLNRQGEIELAKRMERGKTEDAEAPFPLPPGLADGARSV